MDIRTLRDDEIEQALTISALSFGNRGGVAESVERGRDLYPADYFLGAFDGGQMAAMMRVLPSRMRLNGEGVPLALVTPVASSHLHRRRGYAGAMLRRSLEMMRDQDQWLAALYTPHPSLYRRYGWEIAADERIFKFNPKDLQLTASPSQRGRLRYVTADEWRELDTVHRAYSAARNGALERDELWWRNWVLRTWSGTPEAILWQTDAGLTEGYILYIEPGWSSRDSGKFIVQELVALTPDARLNLLAVMAQQDIREEVVYYAPSDDALPLLFAEEERLKIEQRHTVLLRIVDVQAALSQRPSLTAGGGCEFSIEVSDAYAPWNAGTWRIQSVDGKTIVERADGPGDLQLDVRYLAPMINGYVTASAAAGAGLVRVSRPGALAEADRWFAVTGRPYFADRF